MTNKKWKNFTILLKEKYKMTNNSSKILWKKWIMYCNPNKNNF